MDHVRASAPQPGGKGARLYIMTLGVLAPYRGYGVGTKLLGRSLTAAARDPSIQEAYLHVQVSQRLTERMND